MFEETSSLCHGRLRRMTSCKRNNKVARLIGNPVASLLSLFIMCSFITSVALSRSHRLLSQGGSAVTGISQLRPQAPDESFSRHAGPGAVVAVQVIHRDDAPQSKARSCPCSTAQSSHLNLRGRLCSLSCCPRSALLLPACVRREGGHSRPQMRALLRKSCSKTLQFRKHPQGIRVVSLYSQLHQIISPIRKTPSCDVRSLCSTKIRGSSSTCSLQNDSPSAEPCEVYVCVSDDGASARAP